MEHRLIILWTICCLCVHSSLCNVKRQFHSEEEFDGVEPPKIFPEAVALEADDMLNTTNIQPGEIVNATELVDNPHVVDLGGKTHEESGNTTTSPKEETCKIPIDWLKGFEEMVKDYRFSDDWLRNSRGVPLIDCSILVIDNETKLQCPIPSVNKTNRLLFTMGLTNVDIKFPDDIKFPLCPQLEKLLIRTTTNPTFNCSDRIEGNTRITICHIPKQWLKDQTIITKLNCTNNGNTTTETETCTISKEIVQKNTTYMMDCKSSDDNGIECLVPKGWLKYNVFSILTCGEHENNTLRNCIFPNSLLTTDTSTENCATARDGNSTECPIYNGINCTKNSNSTKLQCWIPHEWLAEVDNVAKLNCTDADNSTQKVCSIPKEWLRSRMANVSETTNANDTNETICYIPKQLLNDNSNKSQLNCSSDNLTTTCQIPNEPVNISTICPLFEEIKDAANALRCIIQYEGNSTIFVCSESEESTLQNETESCNTSKEALNITSVEHETSTENNSTVEDVKISSNQTKEQSRANVDNSSEISTVVVPYLVESSTENQPNSSITPVKLNTEKDQEAPSEGVTYEETEHGNKGDTIEITQSSSEPNTKNSTAVPGQTEAKSQSPLENEVAHYEAAAPAAALSQLHTEHTHANVNEQTVTFLRPTESAAILVGVFIAFAVLGYAGLLIWRRMLEKRYGNRQLLINEDDDFSNANNFEMPMYELQERFWPRGVDRGISSCDNAQKSLNKK